MNSKIKMFVFLVAIGFASSMLFSALPWEHYVNCFENGMVPDLSSKEKKCIELATPQAFGISHDDDYVMGKITWEQASYTIKNGTGFAKIIVTDPDMNKFSHVIDTLKVFAWSDTDREEITLTLYETENNSGVFERTFGLSDERSAPSILHTGFGDTILAKYIDTTLPPDSESQSIEMTAAALVDTISRFRLHVPVYGFHIEDLHGGSLVTPIIPAEKQVKIVAGLENQNNRTQDFVYLVQVQDKNGLTVSLSWITGVLDPFQSIASAQSWIPQQPGEYDVTGFVWESIDNPSALSAPQTTPVTVRDPKHEQYVEPSIIGLGYNQILKQPLPNLTIKVKGVGSNYERIPHVMIKPDIDEKKNYFDKTEKEDVIVWNNLDFASIPVERTHPGSFCNEYHLNDIGGPVILNQTGTYDLIVTFKDMIYSKEFSVTDSMIREDQIDSSLSSIQSVEHCP